MAPARFTRSLPQSACCAASLSYMHAEVRHDALQTCIQLKAPCSSQALQVLHADVQTCCPADLHTIVIYGVMLAFIFTTFCTNYTLGSFSTVYNNIQKVSAVVPREGNKGGKCVRAHADQGVCVHAACCQLCSQHAACAASVLS